MSMDSKKWLNSLPFFGTKSNVKECNLDFDKRINDDS